MNLVKSKPNLDCNYTFPIGFTPNSLLGAKSIGKLTTAILVRGALFCRHNVSPIQKKLASKPSVPYICDTSWRVGGGSRGPQLPKHGNLSDDCTSYIYIRSSFLNTGHFFIEKYLSCRIIFAAIYIYRGRNFLYIYICILRIILHDKSFSIKK